MMSVASKYVIICLDSIVNKKERNDIISCIEKSEKNNSNIIGSSK